MDGKSDFIKALEKKIWEVCEHYGFSFEKPIFTDEDFKELLFKVILAHDINYIPTAIFREPYKIKDVGLAKKFLEINLGFIKNNKDYLEKKELVNEIKSYFNFIDSETKKVLAATLTEKWPGKKNITDALILCYQNTNIKFSELVESFGGERETTHNRQVLKELLNDPYCVNSSIKYSLGNTIEIEKISNEKFSEIIDYVTPEKNPVPIDHVGKGDNSVNLVYMMLRRREKINFDDLCRILSFFANNDEKFFDRLFDNMSKIDHCYFDARVGEKIKDQKTKFMDWLLQKLDGEMKTDKASTKKILFRFFDKLYKTGDKKTEKVLDIMKYNGDFLAVKNDYDKFVKFKKSLESVCTKKNNTEFLFDESNINDLLNNKIELKYDIPEYMDPEKFFYENKIFPYNLNSNGIISPNQLKRFMEVFKLNYYPLSVMKDSASLEDHDTFKKFVETNTGFLEKSTDFYFYYDTINWFKFYKISKIYDWEKKTGSSSWDYLPDHYGQGVRLNSNDKDLIDRLVNIFITKSGWKFNDYDAVMLNELIYNVKLEKNQYEQLWQLMEKNGVLYFYRPEHLNFCPEDQLISYVKKLLATKTFSGGTYLTPYQLKDFLTLGSSLETKIEIINCILETPNIIIKKSQDFLEKEFFNENGYFMSFDAKDFDHETHKPRKYNDAEKKIILEARPKFQVKLLEYEFRSNFKGCTVLEDVVKKFETAVGKYKNDKDMILRLKNITIDSFIKLLCLGEDYYESKFDFFELDNGLYEKLGLFDGDLPEDQKQKLVDVLEFDIKNDSGMGELSDEEKKSIDAKLDLLKKMFSSDLSSETVNKLKSKIKGNGIVSKYILSQFDNFVKDNKNKDEQDKFVNQNYNRQIHNELLEKFDEVFKGGEEAARKNGEFAYFSTFRYHIYDLWNVSDWPEEKFKKEIDKWKDILNEYKLERENKENGKDDVSSLTGYRAENKKKLKELMDEYKNSGDEDKIKAIENNEMQIRSEIKPLELFIYILSDQNDFDHELGKLRSKIDKLIEASKNADKNNSDELLNFADKNNMNLNQAAEFNKKDILEGKNSFESENDKDDKDEKKDIENNFESEGKHEDNLKDNINILVDEQKEFILSAVNLFCENKDKDEAKEEVQRLLENKAFIESISKNEEFKACINEFEKTLLAQKENIKKATGFSDKDLENPRTVLKRLKELKDSYNKSDEMQKKRLKLSFGIPGAATVGLGVASIFFSPALICLFIAGTATGVSGITEFCLRLRSIFKKLQLAGVFQKIKSVSDNYVKQIRILGGQNASRRVRD